MSSVRTLPTMQPSRIVHEAIRAHTEPALEVGGRFLGTVLQRRHTQDLEDEGIALMPEPKKKITQVEQDAIDEKARKRAMTNLVSSWQERLQLISVITTFFASTEAAMLVNTRPTGISDWQNNALNAANASLLGALIVHVYAAVLSFLAAFLLIRYKLQEATREEMIAEGIKMVSSPPESAGIIDEKRVFNDDLEQQRTLNAHDTQTTYVDKGHHHHGAGTQKRKNSLVVEPPIISTNPHLEQVGPFMSNVSSHLLSRTHALCVCLAAAGFVLAIVGVVCYAWALQPLSVSIFVSICLGLSVLALVVLLI